jgi:glycosyltransferase involved in cell wall biosynthesis
MPYSVVHGLTGRVVPPDDPEALAKALECLLRTPDRLATMGQLARSRVLERFGQARFAATGAEIFARLPVRRAAIVPGVASPAS